MRPGQVWALLAAAGRELLWGLPAVSREIDRWRTRAWAIPDRPLREDALDSLTHKRDHAEGAAFFAVLPRRRDLNLLRLLVAYQTIWDFLDNVSERDPGEANALQLHRALVEALDPQAPISDYYVHHPWKDDGGYLPALVRACRTSCTTLPSYARVRPHVLEGVRLCAIQSINHDPDPERRDAALRAWADGESRARAHPISWFELTAAASGFTPHPLLSLAAEAPCDERDIANTLAVYFPWVSLSITMLDSYADQVDDARNGSHSYIAHYDDGDLAVRRLCEIVGRAVREARRLRHGRRHATLVACMLAMYLSRDRVYTRDMRTGTRALADAGGSLTRLLLPVVRTWRVAYLRRPVAEVKRAAREASLPLPRSARRALPPSLPLPRAAQTFMIWRSPHACLEYCRRRYGSRFTINKTSHPPLVFLSDAEDIKAMFAAPADALHPGEGASTIEPLVGEQAFMLRDEDEHLSGRREILPPFHAAAVRAHAELVGGVVKRAVGSWPRDTPIALHPRLRALTLETILRVIFSASGCPDDGHLYTLRDRLLSMLSVTGSAVFPEPLLRHGPGLRIWRRFLHERATVDELIYAIIGDRCGEHGARDVLGRLLCARNLDSSPMSARQVRDNLMSIVLAGHETTASELAWTFQLLAHNPAVQRRLHDEIDRDAGDEYLTATVQEVLRHRPVFLFGIPRAVKRPIEIGGWTYQPPTQLLACIYLLHHDPSVYSDPHEFRPERFVGGRRAGPMWLPWGGGRKRCPGLHLAMLEMKTVLRTVLASSFICPASRRIERPLWRSVIVTPHAGSRVILRRRERPGRHRPGSGPPAASPSEKESANSDVDSSNPTLYRNNWRRVAMQGDRKSSPSRVRDGKES